MKPIVRSFSGALAVVVLVVLTITASRAQMNVKLGVGFGAMIPTSDFSGSTSEFYNGSRYGLSSGPTIDIKAKVGLSGWSLIGEIDYSALRNSGNSEPGQGEVDVSQQVLSLKVGPEFRIDIPMLPVTPYIGANFALNRFTGETTFQGVSKVPSATFAMEDATRFGIGFLGGADRYFIRFLGQ